MKYFFNLVALLVVQKCDAIDRWLCRRPHWAIRLWWCSLWVRDDEFHSSLDSDFEAMYRNIRFRRTLLRAWMDITRRYPNPTPADMRAEDSRLKALETRLKENYSLNLVRRRNIAHERDLKNSSLL